MGCFQRKPPGPPPQRQVFIGRHLNHHIKKRSNRIKTTKYTRLNFFPKALLLQCIRPANFVYLITAILQMIPVISALSTFTAIAPFIVVLAISLIRQAYDDYVRKPLLQKRYKNDKQTNNKKAFILQNGQFVPTYWKDIHVGDIALVQNGQEIPADILLLHSSQENGVCYVETANLDGQRNLKTKKIASNNLGLQPSQYEQLYGRHMIVDGPTIDIHEFNGQLYLSQQPSLLQIQNLLLRGTQLKNTDQIVGCVVYSGMETKIMKNLNAVKHKVSGIERRVNIIQLILFFVLFILCLITSLLYYRHWSKYESRQNILYLRNKYTWGISKDAALIGLTAFLLLTFLIPISLSISMEIMKTFQSDLVQYDIEMSQIVDGKRRHAKALNSGIIEQLGMVSYVLTDKTGTLTSNIMEFKSIWTAGKQYNLQMMERQKGSLTNNREFVDFWTAVTLCHDVVVDKRKQEYQGSSADEVCFLEAAKKIGYVFQNRTNNTIEVSINGQRKTYELYQMLPFTSRKMMSVIVRDPSSGILLLTKGADSEMLAQRSPQTKNVQGIEQSLKNFSKQGLRTLVFARRTLNAQQFQTFQQQWAQIKSMRANQQVDGKQASQKQRELLSRLESQLELIGVSAIEDKLQEGVPETIKRLQQAGIRIAMITGDKLETAQNIGYLSNFIAQNNTVFRITKDSKNYHQQLINIYNQMNQSGQAAFSLIIEGVMIQTLIENPHPQIQMLFSNIVYNCRSLIFCRSTPAQKGLITKYYKKTFRKTVLCIGDGGNDVNMIQQGDIGVGILGKEGNQAAAASDFNFTQFRFLDRLLLHHGRWAYYRIAYFFVYYGFKNILITVILFCFLAYCGWSASNILSNVYLAAYNSALSVAMTIYYGTWQQDINCDMYPPARPYQPLFYKQYKKMGLFSYTRYFLWSISGAVIGAYVFFTTIYGVPSDSPLDGSGRVPDRRTISANLSLSAILITTIIIYMDCYNFTIWTWFIFIILTLLVIFLFYIIENFIRDASNYLAFGDNFRWKFWFLVLLNTITVYALRHAYNTLRFAVWPSNVMQWMTKRNSDYQVVKYMQSRATSQRNIAPYAAPYALPYTIPQTEQNLVMVSPSVRVIQPIRAQQLITPRLNLTPNFVAY